MRLDKSLGMRLRWSGMRLDKSLGMRLRWSGNEVKVDVCK